MNNNEIVIVKAGIPSLNQEIESILDKYIEEAQQAKENENKLRTSIQDAMINNGIYSARVGKYQISIVMPKPHIEFDIDRFINEQSQDIVNAFVNVNTSLDFDVESFKKEQPEMYMKYCKKTETVEVNYDKLNSTFPAIAEKYSMIKDSTKKPSIRITKN